MSKNSPFLEQMRDSLENFEASFDPMDWTTLEQKLDLPVLEQIRDSLDTHEAEYDPSDWTALEQRMDAAMVAKPLWQKPLVWGLSGLVAAAASIFYFMPSEHLPEMPQDNPVELIATIPSNGELAGTETEPKTEKPQTKVDPVVDAPIAAYQISTSSAENTAEKKSTPIIPTNYEPDPEPVAQVDSNDPIPMAGPPVEEAWEAQVSSSVQNMCLGEKVQFTSRSSVQKMSYHWDFGDGSTSTEPNPTHIYKSAGTYSVELQMTPKNHKNVPKTIFREDWVTVHGAPVADIFPPRQNEISNYYDPTFLFEANILSGNNWVWHFGDGKTSIEKAPKHLYRIKGDYPVMLVVENQNGCADTARQLLNIYKDYDLLAATGFSPTNNDQLNDKWLPVALESGKHEFEIRVHDLANNLVFVSNHPTVKWDGRKLGSGEMAQKGQVFGWVAKVKEEGEIKTYTGTVTISTSQ